MLLDILTRRTEFRRDRADNSKETKLIGVAARVLGGVGWQKGHLVSEVQQDPHEPVNVIGAGIAVWRRREPVDEERARAWCGRCEQPLCRWPRQARQFGM